jgi:hypothetical protein
VVCHPPVHLVLDQVEIVDLTPLIRWRCERCRSDRIDRGGPDDGISGCQPTNVG